MYAGGGVYRHTRRVIYLFMNCLVVNLAPTQYWFISYLPVWLKGKISYLPVWFKGKISYLPVWFKGKARNKKLMLSVLTFPNIISKQYFSANKLIVTFYIFLQI